MDEQTETKEGSKKCIGSYARSVTVKSSIDSTFASAIWGRAESQARLRIEISAGHCVEWEAGVAEETRSDGRKLAKLGKGGASRVRLMSRIKRREERRRGEKRRLEDGWCFVDWSCAVVIVRVGQA